MKSKLFAVLAAGVVLLLVSGPMFAHHGGVQYDTKHAVTVTGTVTEFMFTNPHVQIHFDVKDETGNVEKWVAERVEREDLEGRGQDHGYWCAAQRRAEDREHHQAGGGERSGAHPGSRRVRSGSGEAKGSLLRVLPTGQFIQPEAKFGCGELWAVFALCQ